jgi:hypothetical protein
VACVLLTFILHGAVAVLYIFSRVVEGSADPSITTAVCGFARQSLEKIDRTRAVAGAALLDVTYLELCAQVVPDHKSLVEIFG